MNAVLPAHQQNARKCVDRVKTVPLKNVAMLLVTALIWGFAFVAQSVGMEHLGPFTFNGVRNLIGGLALIPCIFFLKGRSGGQKAPEQGRGILLLGGVCCGVALFLAGSCQQIGIQYTTVGKAGFITALYIVIVPVMGIFLKKACGLQVWVSVAIAVAGFYLLTMQGGISLSLGDGFVLAGSFLFSIHILVIDYFAPKVDGVKMSCIQFFVCGILSCIAMLLWEEPKLGDILLAWKPILYAGGLSSGVGYTLQILGQRNFHPTVASLLLSLESVFSVVAGWLLLDEALSVRELFGCGLIFGAIILAQLPERKKKEA